MNLQSYLKTLSRRRRWVIKIGTSVLAPRGKELSAAVFRQLAAQVVALQKSGKQVVIVSSGAVAAGMEKLRLNNRPTAMAMLQAAAAVGQSHLVHTYEMAFKSFHARVAQVLLSKDDLENKKRFANARHTFGELLRLNVIPIVNENDSVATEEMKVGDNDNLSALVANLVQADQLILLTDVDGYYTKHPHKETGGIRIPVVGEVDAHLIRHASGSDREKTVGGMRTKLQAARMAARFKIPTVVADGRDRSVLLKIAKGRSVGTLFLPKR